MAASRRMTVSGSTPRPGARQSISESWESRWRAWVDSMTVLYLPPNASVLADQIRDTGVARSLADDPPPPARRRLEPNWPRTLQVIRKCWGRLEPGAGVEPATYRLRRVCPATRAESPSFRSTPRNFGGGRGPARVAGVSEGSACGASV